MSLLAFGGSREPGSLSFDSESVSRAWPIGDNQMRGLAFGVDEDGTASVSART